MAVICGYFGLPKVMQMDVWRTACNVAQLKEVSDAYDITMRSGPSWSETTWVVAHFQIPSRQVMKFVKENGCEPSKRLQLHRYHGRLPKEFESLPADGIRFHKMGLQSRYEILIDSNGTVLFYAILDD